MELSLKLQPGLAPHLLSIVPPEANLCDFVMEGLREGYFRFIETQDRVSLCYAENAEALN
ncbi:MAG: hypothetical protein HQM12_20070 [SAR324 cluster bacterium]|nr:hypothetical protein [SAR324 cluster bacterium]